MKHKTYKEKKQEFDVRSLLYLVNRLSTETKNSDAFREGIIDGVGNVQAHITPDKKWAFSAFDRIVKVIKENMDSSELAKLTKSFDFSLKIDPLYIISCEKIENVATLIDSWGKIISLFNDSEFLDESYKRENLKAYDYSLLDLSRTITCITTLLYSLTDDKIPSSTDFAYNVLPSVECTWRITPYKDYVKVKSWLESNRLVDTLGQTTNKGIKLLVECAKIAISSNLLNPVTSRIENKYNSWKKLSEVK